MCSFHICKAIAAHLNNREINKYIANLQSVKQFVMQSRLLRVNKLKFRMKCVQLKMLKVLIFIILGINICEKEMVLSSQTLLLLNFFSLLI